MLKPKEVTMITIRHFRTLSAMVAVSATLAAGMWSSLAAAAPAAKSESVSFADDVLPILQVRCLECHKPGAVGYEKSGLDLRSYEGLMKGTKHGPIVIPSDAVTSNLLVLIEGRADKSLRMPHGKKKLSSCDIDAVRRWIINGAKKN